MGWFTICHCQFVCVTNQFIIINKYIDYFTSSLLFISIILCFGSFVFDMIQFCHRFCQTCALPQKLKYLNCLSFIVMFIALNLFIFIFFCNQDELENVVGGSLIGITWGFWCTFISTIILLIVSFLEISFSSPPKVKKDFF